MCLPFGSLMQNGEDVNAKDDTEQTPLVGYVTKKKTQSTLLGIDTKWGIRQRQGRFPFYLFRICNKYNKTLMDIVNIMMENI